MKNTTKGKIIKGAALTLDVAAPLGATLSQFPVWVEQGADATISGLFILFAFLSCIPFMKQIKAWLKSPSAWVMWVVLTVFVIALRCIIDQMAIICLVGAVANVIGAGIHKIGEHIAVKPDKEETTEETTETE
ncbi:MAG: hypothetical protein LUD19_06550 [Clostridia bacterium]|nr:hypothetical protein [Clostridia bacterium]